MARNTTSRNVPTAVLLILTGISSVLCTTPANAQSATDVDRVEIGYTHPMARGISGSLSQALGLPACDSGSVLTYNPNYGGQGWACVDTVNNAAQAENATYATNAGNGGGQLTSNHTYSNWYTGGGRSAEQGSHGTGMGACPNGYVVTGVQYFEGGHADWVDGVGVRCTQIQ